MLLLYWITTMVKLDESSSRIFSAMFLIVLSVQRFRVTDGTFVTNLDPDLNEILFETERITLTCSAESTIVNPSFVIMDKRGSDVVRNNAFVSTPANSGVVYFEMNGYTINLQIEITDDSRSSFTCRIFDDGNFVSQEEINFDVRSRDEPVCLLSTGPNVMVGDNLEVGCYQGHPQPATSVEWRQTKVNGMTDEDLPSITSALINQFKRKTSASLTVTAEDNGSIFQCTATASGGTRQCTTEVISIVDDITVSFVPSIARRLLEVGQMQEVRCIPSVSTASVMWQHDYTESETVTVVPLDSSLRIMIKKPTGLSDGAILSFECTATLGSLRASATFELVVDLVHSTTKSPSRTTSKTSEEVSEETEETEDTEDTEETEGMGPKNGDSDGGIFDSPITLYLGGGLAAILIIVIIIILIAICKTHTNTPKTKQKRDERSIDNISYVEDHTDDDPSVTYAAVRKANPARVVSSPDVVPYSDVNKRHVLIDEDEIYDESQNWWKAEEI